MNPDKRNGLILVFIIIVVLTIIAAVVYRGIEAYSRAKSLEAIGEADYVLNNGKNVEAIDYSVIIDQDTGIEYLYFPGLGVTPYLDENGEVLRVVE